MSSNTHGDFVRNAARECGFELAGIAPAGPTPDFDRFQRWVDRGMAGHMGYLTDHRAILRSQPRNLLPDARCVICVGKLYNGPQPYSIQYDSKTVGWISRYAWGPDYHRVLRDGLESLAGKLRQTFGEFSYRVCVDTAPILERSLARSAGLGWIGKNTCLINQGRGSWFFLGELLTSLELSADEPPDDRCGTCTRCIEACPTQAIVPDPLRGWQLDAKRCLSYLTIELRGAIPDEYRPAVGNHVFGCDICQDVCPWNRRAPSTREFAPVTDVPPPLDKLAALTEDEFRAIYRPTPIERARYRGFLRNVAVAMGNSGLPRFLEPLRRLAGFPDDIVAEHARWALRQPGIVE